MARPTNRFIPRVAQLEDRVTPVSPVNDLSGLQGDFNLADGVADAGGGVVTLNAALQQARHNVLNGGGPESLSFAASGTLFQTISADFPLTVTGGSGQPLVGAITLTAGGAVHSLFNAGGPIRVSGGASGNAASNIRFASTGGLVAVGGINPSVAAVTFLAAGAVQLSGTGGSIAAVTGPADIVLDGNGAVVDGLSVRSVSIRGDGNTVRNCTITGDGTGGGSSGDNDGKPFEAHITNGVGIQIVDGSDNAVLDNIVRNVPGVGIVVSGSSPDAAADNTILGNSVFDTRTGTTPGVAGGIGILLSGGTRTRVLDNSVSASAVYGIQALSSTALTLSGNSVAGRGIRIDNASADASQLVVVSSNSVVNSPAVGIEIQNTRRLNVTGNAVTGGSGVGMAVGATSGAAEQYLISSNDGQAISVALTNALSNLTATGNDVEQLTVGGSAGAASVVVETNTVGQSGGPGDVSVSVGFVSQTLSVSRNTARAVRVAGGTPADRRGSVSSNLVNAAGLPETAALVATGDRLDVSGNTVYGGSAGGLLYIGNGGRLASNRVGVVSGGSGSTNSGTGVTITGNNNTLTGNRIEGNTGVGLRIDGSDNTVGPASPGGANVIRGNGSALGRRGHGVWATGDGNTMRVNAISSNAGRGIALGDPNRLLINGSGSYDAAGRYVPADQDAGANGLQNHPVYSHTDVQGRVFWVLNSTPGHTFTVDFYANPTRSAAEFGEGENYLFTVQVGSAADPEGDGRFVFQVTGLPAGALVSATATDAATGDTSELSLVDQDGDALPDEWEVRGIDTNLDGTAEVVLPGAVVTQRDIYIEVDSMAGFAPLTATVPGVPADLATGTSLDLVVKSFLAAPAALTSSPGGIRLHVQLDAHEQAVSPVDFPNGLSDLDSFRAAHFGTAAEQGDPEKLAAKRLAYRYAVFGRSSGAGSGSGFAEIYGNDFAVTLGSPGWRNPDYRRADLWAEDQAATFMHELGHTLGLHHGGGGTDPGDSLLSTSDPARGINYAPNYLSVMNYAWEYRYSRNRAYTAGEQDFADTWRLDFSRTTLNPLDEANLNEATAIAPNGTAFANARPTVRLGGVVGPVVPGARAGDYGPFKGGYASTFLYTTPDNGIYLGPQFVRLDGPVDWNGDGDTNDSGVRRGLADKNGDDAVGGPGGFSLFAPDGNGGQTSNTYEEDPLVLLGTFAPDWSLLLFNIRESPNFPEGSHIGHADGDTDEDGLTADELALDVIAEQGGADVGVSVQTSATTVTAGQTVTYTVTLVNSGPGDAGQVEVSGLLAAGAVFVSGSAGVLLVGNSIAFALPSLDAGQAATFTFMLRAQAAGTLTQTLGVFTLGDTNPTNDVFATTTTVRPGVPTSPTSPAKPNGFTAVGADAGNDPVAILYNPDGSVRLTDTAFDPAFRGGVRVATGDFNGDGQADLVEGTGPGAPTQVRVIDGTTGQVLFAVSPFEASFTGGVYVAAGDLDGDGLSELVVTPDEGGGPRVTVYHGGDFRVVANFFGIDDANFRGGARAALGDINGDGVADLVVAAGFGGGPRVAVFTGQSVMAGRPQKPFNDLFVFEQGLRNGAFVAAGDVNGDGFAELIAGGGPGGAPRVIALSGIDLTSGKGDASAMLVNAFVGDPEARGGVRVAAKNLDGDANADVVVGSGSNDGSRVTGYLGRQLVGGVVDPVGFLDFDAFPGFNGGVFVG